MSIESEDLPGRGVEDDLLVVPIPATYRERGLEGGFWCRSSYSLTTVMCDVAQ